MHRTVNTDAGRIDYELIQTQRKSMELRVLEGGKLRLFAPRRAALRSADAFVAERADWILYTREAMRDYARKYALRHPVSDGAALLYEGRPVPLRVRRAERDRVWLDGGFIHVSAVDTDEDALRAQLQNWLTERARERIQERLDWYIPRVGRGPGRVAIRAQRTRWGSCSNRHNLNFNWKLIMAPPEALDYVVIHELCHLYEFNHSERFWSRVLSHQRDYQTWKAWLKENGDLLGL